jgi:hypothetical protein
MPRKQATATPATMIKQRKSGLMPWRPATSTPATMIKQRKSGLMPRKPATSTPATTYDKTAQVRAHALEASYLYPPLSRHYDKTGHHPLTGLW